MQISLRPLQPPDMDSFLQLGAATCGSLHRLSQQSEADLLGRFSEFVQEFAFEAGSEIWIAETTGGVYTGHLWLHESQNRFNGQRELWIWDISVLAEYRGRGIGGSLLDHARERAAARGCGQIWLLVSEHNPEARALYNRFGLRDAARMMTVSLS